MKLIQLIITDVFNAAQPGEGRVQVLGSKKGQKPFSRLSSVFRLEGYCTVVGRVL